jgi:hypothetical protein
MKIIQKEFNGLTGKETMTERDETPIEKKFREKFQKDLIEAQAESEARELAKSALLDKLGITADEANLLLA